MSLKIYDTTLRDGMQGEKISFTLEEKLQVARRLDSLGLHYIEGGFPLANQKEEEFFREARKIRFENARVAAFGSTRRPNGKASEDPHLKALVNADTPVVTIVGKSWTRHVTEVLRTTLEENLAMIEDSARYLKSAGREVVYDAEHFFDGYREDPDYALRSLEAARKGGADIVVVCDTNGGVTTSDFKKALESVRARGLVFGVHLHNDAGLAAAHSLLAVDFGATQIQGTMNGWGERSGNANLCTIIPNLHFKLGLKVFTDEKMRHLTPVSRYVDELANLVPDNRQPFVGVSAFAHKAGQHADVIIKNPLLMEHMNGELVGNERRVLLSELAGKSTLALKLGKFGNFDKNDKVVEKLTATLKEKESQGYEYEAAEESFELLMRTALEEAKGAVHQPMFRILKYKVGTTFASKPGKLETTAELVVETAKDGKKHKGAAKGNGPVAALDGALRKAIAKKHPFVAKVKLTDYKVRILDGSRATGATTRVFIRSTDGEKTCNTVGVSENIIEASCQALIDSYEYFSLETKN